MLEHSHHYFNQAADILALDGKMREILLRPNRVVKVAIVEEDLSPFFLRRLKGPQDSRNSEQQASAPVP